MKKICPICKGEKIQKIISNYHLKDKPDYKPIYKEVACYKCNGLGVLKK